MQEKDRKEISLKRGMLGDRAEIGRGFFSLHFKNKTRKINITSYIHIFIPYLFEVKPIENALFHTWWRRKTK